MNRPGQPPQRPQNLPPTSAMGGQFRGQFQGGGYGMPPRNMMQGFPAGLPTHRPNMIPQPSPNYLQQQQQQQQQQPQPRTQSSFPFGAGGGALQQQQQQPQQASLQHGQQQQTAGDLGLDPNDFPALGSAPSANASATPGSAASNQNASYASQAAPLGQAVNGTTGTPVVGSQQRDFTPDDFPALGGHPQNVQQHQQPSGQQQPSSQDPNATSHPPGLNGFPHSPGDIQASQQHRPSLLGSLGGGVMQQNHIQQQPGLLNLGQVRAAQAGFPGESDKSRTNHAGWSASSAGGATGSQFGGEIQNGPPGLPPTPAYVQQQQQQGQQVQQPPSQQSHPPHPFDPSQPLNNTSTRPSTNLPQTPAQQVLMSAADRWGLLGLIAILRNPDIDTTLLSGGTDLATMGLDMETQGNLYSTFITPWSDSSAAHAVEPDFVIPTCYNVNPPPPGPSKANAFSDETLFFMFYASPRDALQEVAAQELWNRNWRFHKEMRAWITKEVGSGNSQKIPGGETGTYTIWDADIWEKAKKDMTVMYTELEEKSQPAFAHAPTLQQNPVGGQVQQQANSVNPVQGQGLLATPAQQQQQAVQGLPQPQRSAFAV